MKAVWTFQDLQLTSRGNLRFTTEQLAALRRTAVILKQDSSTAATRD